MAQRSTHGSKTFSMLILFPALFFLASCAHLPMDSRYRGPEPLPSALEREYSYPAYTGPYDERVLKEEEKFVIKRITFPSTRNLIPAGPIAIDYYDIGKEEKHPVIMVLPILGGNNAIAKIFAAYFADNGYASVIVHRQKEYKKIKQLHRVDRTLRQIVLDHRQVLDWIETRKELDTERTGVFGVSMGGIKAALVSALDKRIRASVLALAGGDLPHILTYSTERGVEKRRLKYMAANKLTLDQFYQQLATTIACDPMAYASHINAARSMMILALFDRAVPFEKGRELKERIGDPETIYLVSGHYSAILYLYYVRRAALDFFRRKLTPRDYSSAFLKSK
ncbi:MAG: alpha/beta hydrolase [Desulfobacteraceae bacterium]|nr:alpha/beta hydrolase [Desulfobacteraceae bacterium]